MLEIFIYSLEFIKIGLLAFGGGLATIPFLKEFGLNYQLFDLEFIVEMIAIAESTPGPIGINMASYVGYKIGGFLIAINFSLALVLPSLVVVIIIARYLKNINHHPKVQTVFKLLKPATLALISAVLIPIIKISFLKTNTILKLSIAIIMFYIYRQLKLHPILLILICGLLGLLFKL